MRRGDGVPAPPPRLTISTAWTVQMATSQHTQRLVTVYGLASSEDRKIRYVGQTVSALPKRLREHTRRELRYTNYKANWVRSVLAAGHHVIIFPIEIDAVLNEAEMRLIAWYRKNGARLVNSTRGGDGIVGLPRTPEHQQKIADAQRGKKRGPLSDEMKARLSVILSTRIFTAEHRARISAARKAQGISPETQAKMAEARRQSPLWRARVGSPNRKHEGT